MGKARGKGIEGKRVKAGLLERWKSGGMAGSKKVEGGGIGGMPMGNVSQQYALNGGYYGAGWYPMQTGHPLQGNPNMGGGGEGQQQHHWWPSPFHPTANASETPLSHTNLNGASQTTTAGMGAPPGSSAEEAFSGASPAAETSNTGVGGGGGLGMGLGSKWNSSKKRKPKA